MNLNWALRGQPNGSVVSPVSARVRASDIAGVENKAGDLGAQDIFHPVLLLSKSYVNFSHLADRQVLLPVQQGRCKLLINKEIMSVTRLPICSFIQYLTVQPDVMPPVVNTLLPGF